MRTGARGVLGIRIRRTGGIAGRRQRTSGKFHVMGAAKLLFIKVDLEFLNELFSIPVISLQELLVVGALLVPIRKQRSRDINALSIPALGNHVHLAARHPSHRLEPAFLD